MGIQSPLELPWFWTVALSYHKHIKGIQEAAAMDFEKVVCPKDLWWDSDKLNEWFEQRSQVKREESEKPW